MTGPAPAVLVAAAHPDDAEIAAGGTIAGLVAGGSRVVVAVFALPEPGDGGRHRRAAAEAAAGVLGHELHWVDGGRHRHVTDLGEVAAVARLDELVREVRPAAVLAHWAGDSHADHVVVARAVAAAARLGRFAVYSWRPSELRTPAFTAFAPTVFVEVTRWVEAKERALAMYGPRRPGFRPLDLASIADADRLYGAVAGCGHAEGFRAERQLGLALTLGGVVEGSQPTWWSQVTGAPSPACR